MDVDLLERCRTHDREAFAGLFALWGDPALVVALVAAPDRARAEAAVGAAFLTAWHDFPSTHSERSLRPWLLGIVARAAAGPGDPADARIASIVRARNDAHAEAAIRAVFDGVASDAHLPQTFFHDEVEPRLDDAAAIEVRRLIAASPEDVWTALVAPDAVPAWSSVADARVRPLGPVQRGSRFVGRTRLAERRAARVEATVTRADRPATLAWFARARLSRLPRALEMHHVIEIREHANGCEVRSRLLGVGVPGGPAGRALTGAYRRIEPGMQASMLHAVERLAGLVERRTRTD